MRGKNTSSLVRQVSETLNCNYGEANYLIDLVFHIIKKELKSEGKLRIAGFGQIKTKIRPGFLKPGVFLPGKAGYYVPNTYTEVRDRRTILYTPDVRLLRDLNKDQHDSQEPGPSPQDG